MGIGSPGSQLWVSYGNVVPRESVMGIPIPDFSRARGSVMGILTLFLSIIITLIYLTLTLILTFTHSLSPTVLTMLSHLPSHNYPHTLT